jgi:hypothetical protein
MNSSALKAFSGLSPPGYRGSATNTMAVNRGGDVFALSDGGLRYTSLLRQEDGCRSLPLSLSGEDKQLLAQMTCIKFNSFGTILLVWGDSAAGVITLPRSYTLYGEMGGGDSTKGCTFIPVLKPENCYGQLVKVQWHPYHAEYVVILHQQGPLQMQNIFTGAASTVALSQTTQYSSFSFGPCIGWMAVSVLVLAESGSVFVVCPFVPVGALLPVEVVVQMAEGLAYENEIVCPRGGDRSKLLKLANLYMSAAFGDLSGEYRAPGNMIRLGGPLIPSEHAADSSLGAQSVDLSYHQQLLLEMLKCPPALQGAVAEICDLSSSGQGQGQGTKRQHAPPPAGAVACDIAVLPAAPGERGDEDDWTSSDCAPVVALVWGDGQSKIGILKGRVCSLANRYYH